MRVCQAPVSQSWHQLTPPLPHPARLPARAVDMHCYHTAWLAWLHPLNEAGRRAQPSPEYHIKRALARLQGMKR